MQHGWSKVERSLRVGSECSDFGFVTSVIRTQAGEERGCPIGLDRAVFLFCRERTGVSLAFVQTPKGS